MRSDEKIQIEYNVSIISGMIFKENIIKGG